MKKYSYSLLVILLIISFTSKVSAFSQGTTAGIVILREASTARSSAMAESFTAMTNDLSCIFYNPAGIVNPMVEESSKELLVTYNQLLEDTRMGLFAYRYDSQKNCFGVALGYFDGGKVDLLFSSGEQTTVSAQQDLMVIIDYARVISRYFITGVGMKVLRSTLAEEFTATTSGIDIGVLFLPPIRGLSFGLAVQNISMGIKYNLTNEPVYRPIRFGVSYRYGTDWLLFKPDLYSQLREKHFFTITADLLYDNEERSNILIGFEWSIPLKGSFRMGYMNKMDIGGFTLGFGIEPKKNFFLDFAIRMVHTFNLPYKLTASYKF